MNIAELLNDKGLKPKVKTETVSKWVLAKKLSTDELIAFAQTAKKKSRK